MREYIIDPITRKIKILKDESTIGVYNDKNVEEVQFSLTDENLAAELFGYNVYINYLAPNSESVQQDQAGEKSYDAENNKLTFSWLIGRSATQGVGKVIFIVCFQKVVDGEVEKEWNTTVASVSVLEGLEPELTEEEQELLASYYDTLVERLHEAGEAVIESIPQDYTALCEEVEDVRQDLANIYVQDGKLYIDGVAYELGGVGVSNIAKTGTDGLVDTYTITMTDGTSYTFTVTNGDASDAKIQGFIDDWLEEHPEATTTVQDGAISIPKLSDGVKVTFELSNDQNIYGDVSISEGSTTFEECFRKVYTEVMDAYAGDINKIPIIVETDQHNALKGNDYDIGIHKSISKIVNWYDVSKFINLGDVVSQAWIDKTSKPWLFCTTLDNMVKAYAPIPLTKQINVVGNHDAFTWENGTYGTKRDEQSHLNKYFRNVNEAQKYGNSGCWVIKDGFFNVKYLVLSAYDSNNDTFYFKSEWLDMMIRELSINDGYDIIIISHQLLNPAYGSRIFPTTEDMIWKGSAENDNSYGLQINVNPILIAKQNKTSGTITDTQGVTHSFDFTNSNTKLLCGLHGHTHYETYNHVNGNYVGYAMSPYTMGNHWIFFLLVNRADKCINVWKMNSQSGASSYGYTKYDVPFDVSDRAIYTITKRVVGTTLFNASTSIRAGLPYSQYVRPASGKTLGDVLIKMGGVDITSQVYDSTNHLIYIENVTGDIDIKAYDSGTDIDTDYWYVTEVMGNITYTTGSGKVISDGGTYSSQVRTAAGYRIKEFSLVKADGTDITSNLTVSRAAIVASITNVDNDMTYTVSTEANTRTREFVDADGTITSNDAYWLNSYEDVTGFDYINVSLGKQSQTGYVAMYDANHQFLKKVSFSSASQNIYIGTATKYIRVGYDYSSDETYIAVKHTGASYATVSITKPDTIGVTGGVTTVKYGDSLTLGLTNQSEYDDADIYATVVMGSTTVMNNTKITGGTLSVPYVTGNITITLSLLRPLVYELANAVTFDGASTSQLVDTGYAPMKTASLSFTILADYTPNTPNNEAAVFNNGPYAGSVMIRKNNGQDFRYAGVNTNVTTATINPNTERVKVAFTHEGDTYTTNVYINTANLSDVITRTITNAGGSTANRRISEYNLFLGGFYDGTKLWKGTIHAFQLWNKVLTAEEIADWLEFSS